jgi:hypothetical protein
MEQAGYCNQKLGLFPNVLSDYNKTLTLNPPAMEKNTAMFRKAIIYSLMNKTDKASAWSLRSTHAGYNSLNDLDSLDAFSNLRSMPEFHELRQRVYETICHLQQGTRES